MLLREGPWVEKKKKAQIVRNFLHVPLMLESCCDTLVWFSSMVRTQEA